jgi:hypothetical protein
MKIIFLDFDGVLNSENWMTSRFDIVDNAEISANYPFYEIDPDAIHWLNEIIRETGAKVVVSSTWRRGRTIEELTDILKAHNFIGEIIGKTPVFNLERDEDVRYTVPRGCEIEWWYESKRFKRINWSIDRQREYLQKAEVKNYIILDDDSDMLLSQREHFIKTSWKTGLTQKDAHLAIKILNTPVENLYYEVDSISYDDI